jgi:ATP-binding protein involved in chromosome partitioning
MSDESEFERAVVAALEAVREPTGKNVLEARVVTGIAGEGKSIRVQAISPGWPEPIRQRIEREIQGAIKAKLPGITEVAVQWGQANAGTGPAAGKPAAQPGPVPGPGGQSTLPPPDIKRIIAVGSGKGGVGKSTIAAAIAYALKHRGQKVGLMDADVYGPSIPHMLGLASTPPTVDAGRYLPHETDGIKVMSMGFLVPPEQAVVWRGPMLHKAVHDFLFLVRWGALDTLVVDLPPGTGDVVLSLSQQLPISGGVIVCTPQDVALLDARKALHMFRTVKIPCRGVVENMSYFLCPDNGKRYDIFGHGGAERWAKEQGLPFLGAVPINISIRENGDRGHVRENFAADNPVRHELLAIADRLLAQLDADTTPAVPTLEIV